MGEPIAVKGGFIQSLLKLTRFGNLVIIAFAQFFTAGCLIGLHTLNDINLLCLVASTVMIAAAGYIINDYYDVKIDYINKPERVIIGKNITRRYAILLHVVLSTLGIVAGAFASWKIGVVNVAAVFLLWLYSNNLKRLAFVGNFTVALLTGLSIFLVDFLYHAVNPLVMVYAAFAFFMTLIREIVKDMEDLKGDHTFGCKTLPILLGYRRTKYIVYAILSMFVAMAIFLNFVYPALPILYYACFVFLPLVWFLVKLIRADTKKDFAWLSGFCKVIILLGIGSMAFV